MLQGNLSSTYEALGRKELALSLKRDVYSGYAKLHGVDDENTLVAANNYASTLVGLERFEEAKTLLRRTIPVARRTLGEVHDVTLAIRSIYANALYSDTGATLDDLREAVTTLEDTERIARRVLGGSHPDAMWMKDDLRVARAALRARDISM